MEWQFVLMIMLPCYYQRQNKMEHVYLILLPEIRDKRRFISLANESKQEQIYKIGDKIKVNYRNQSGLNI
jgi:hypothetical protein